MKKLAGTILAISVSVVILFGCSGNEEQVLHIATAANVQFAMKELVKEFNKETGIKSEIILGSSGKLLAQIREGAPFDVFVSADMKYPQTLYEEGLTTSKPEIYARGVLVLWTMNNAQPDISMLNSPGVERIAMANPKTAPYGKAAEEVLQHYGLYDSLQPKLVFGESISQTNQFILSRTAQVGFTSKSVVLAPGMEGKWIEIDSSTYTPILQGIVVLNSETSQEKEAEKFKAFLLGPKAAQILKRYGYLPKTD